MAVSPPTKTRVLNWPLHESSPEFLYAIFLFITNDCYDNSLNENKYERRFCTAGLFYQHGFWTLIIPNTFPGKFMLMLLTCYLMTPNAHLYFSILA